MLRFWKKKRPTPHLVKITFEMTPEANIVVHTEWPEPTSDEHAMQIVREVVVLSSMINKGDLADTTRESIKIHAEETDTELIGNMALRGLDAVEFGGPPNEDYIRPIQVFRDPMEVTNGD